MVLQSKIPIFFDTTIFGLYEVQIPHFLVITF
jgi:hypothetical protein